jgi:hypothetical protein
MPAARSNRTPLSRGIGHGGKGPPHGVGGPIPIPIPAAWHKVTMHGDRMIARVKYIFLKFMFNSFDKFN